ncbi:MAG: methylase involved in ubiquinone/menaquinone biosynthesi [Bacteroidetes bacterium]|nr:MAG: methylase involved in ubiquinone/menaquinone biosynthesi [Bacteroidota bacterium]
MTASEKYLHGFTSGEQERLYRQARFLENIVYSEIDLSGVKQLLEVGCGVGAQSQILLRRFPDLFLTSIDFSDVQLQAARKNLDQNPVAANRFELLQMDAQDMPLPSKGKFDGAFLCWVLEHVPDPKKVLSEVRRVLQPGSTVYVTEVLNATFFIEPYSPSVLQYWMRFNDLQYDMGGDPFIGAKLGNLLLSLGYVNIRTQVKTFFLDNRQPAKRAEMIDYWSELMLSGAPNLLEAGYVTEETVTKVREEMHRCSKDPNAVFFYSLVQASAQTA